MKVPRLYTKPFITAGVFFLLSISVFTVGIVLESLTGDMNYFALVAFGVFFFIVAVVVFFTYAAMESKYRRLMKKDKLIDVVLSDDMHGHLITRTSEDIQSANKGLLFLMLGFCFGFGLLFLLFAEDGLIFFFIFAGIGIFLSVSAWVITTYRTRKIAKSSRRVVLTRNAAFVGGEFHAWDMPGNTLTGARFLCDDTTPSLSGYLEITYVSAAIPGPSEHTVLIPVPSEWENRVAFVLDSLLCDHDGSNR